MKSRTNNKPYEIDASQIKGKATKVIIPRTIQELKEAVKTNPKITIRGSGTGLVGGAVPQNDVVIDTSALNRIGELDKQRRTVEVEAGVILDELNNYLERFGLEFPVNPSSHSIASIGGMIATDAVGSRAVKYGNTSKWIQWIEIVDNKGDQEKKGITELSDYTGMEGITGIIVKANLKLVEKKERTADLIEKDNLNEIIELTRELKRNAEVSMIEFIDKTISQWLNLNEKYHLIVEYESDKGQLKNKEYEKILTQRDKIYPILAQKGYTKIEDPKLLLDRIENILQWLELNKIPVFGHLGVGILHPCFQKQQEKLIPEMMKIVKKSSGSISGEHGIGLEKKQYIEPNDKKILINIKKRTDSLNKFNSGKII